MTVRTAGKSVRKSPARLAAVAAGFRSAFEQNVLEHLAESGAPFEYEPLLIPYARVATKHTYKPDVVLASGIMLELKGRFTVADRTKMLLVKQQHPSLDIRIVFQNAHTKLSKNSKTTYGQWASKNGFPFCHKILEADWLAEEPKL